MTSRHTVIAVAALGVAAAFGSYLLFGSLYTGSLRAPKLPYRSAGITISAVPAGGLASGTDAAEGAAGDFWVQNGALSFVIGADAPGVERQARYGVLLDLARKDFHVDELVDLRPVLRVAGKSVPLSVSGVRLVTNGEFPFLRVEHVNSDGKLLLFTDFQAAPGESKIRLVTRLSNASDKLLRDVELGERTRWPGAPTFAPRIGFPRQSSRAEVPWIGRQGARLSYALAFTDGPAQAAFFFDIIGQVGQETLSRVGDAPAHAFIEYHRELVVVEGDLGRAAEVALRALGHEIGWIEGRIVPPPAWAIVEARSPDGAPALTVSADHEGFFTMPLPVGDYRLVLRTPGGEEYSDVSVPKDEKVVVKLVAPIPGRLKFSVVDGDGAALAARLTLRGIPPTKDPDLLPIEQGGGAKNVLYTRDGNGQAELPPGRYHVVVSHGSEYEISEHDVELDAENGASLSAVLAHSVDTKGWLACDFHLHAAPSRDSNVSLPDRVLSLLAEGIEFAVPTDHNHITDYSRAIAEHHAKDELGSVPGVEITTSTWGHFNAYPYPPHAPPPPFSGVNPIEIFAAVHARAPAAVIQVNHPRMPGVGYFNRIELNPSTGVAEAEGASFEFDALEVVNGYDLESPELIASNLREFFTLLNVGRRYTATGNSDSHRLLINWAGYPRTYVRVSDDRPGKASASEVANSVNDGHAEVSNGIFLLVTANGNAGPGDTVNGSRVSLRVEARAPSWVDLRRIELWINGGLFATSPTFPKPLPQGRLLWQTELDLQLDSWIVVVARGDEPMTPVFFGRRVLPFAFINPIFVDADQNGVFHAPDAPEPAASAAKPP